MTLRMFSQIRFHSSNVSNVSNVKIMYIYTEKMKNENYFDFLARAEIFTKSYVTALPYPQTRINTGFER